MLEEYEGPAAGGGASLSCGGGVGGVGKLSLNGILSGIAVGKLTMTRGRGGLRWGGGRVAGTEAGGCGTFFFPWYLQVQESVGF